MNGHAVDPRPERRARTGRDDVDVMAAGRETVGELRKVVWPTREEALRLTGIVLTVIIVMAIISVLLAIAVPMYQKSLLRTHPRVNVRLSYRRSDQVYDDVILGAADLGLGFNLLLGYTGLLSFGHGDGGGGPTREMLDRYERFREFPGLPRLDMTKVEDFYQRVDPAPLPVWVGEQYLELHRGTYTTQGRVKWLNRKLEQTLGQAEAACALASRLTGAAYPHDALYALWKVLLRNQFHDILPGSSVRAVYEVAHQEMGEALFQARALRDAALQAMSERVAGEGEVAWNLSLEERECRGAVIPPLGYARVPADPAPAAPDPAARTAAGGMGLTLENEHLRVVVNDDGTLQDQRVLRRGREDGGEEEEQDGKGSHGRSAMRGRGSSSSSSGRRPSLMS